MNRLNKTVFKTWFSHIWCTLHVSRPLEVTPGRIFACRIRFWDQKMLIPSTRVEKLGLKNRFKNKLVELLFSRVSTLVEGISMFWPQHRILHAKIPPGVTSRGLETWNLPQLWEIQFSKKVVFKPVHGVMPVCIPIHSYMFMCIYIYIYIYIYI